MQASYDFSILSQKASLFTYLQTFHHRFKKYARFCHRLLLAAFAPKTGFLARPARFERAAFRLGGERSILLSYKRMKKWEARSVSRVLF